jgi:cytochrome c556
MMPGRKVARPGEKSEAPGVELEPAEMEVNIEKDLAEFHKAALRLHDAATQALVAIDAKDPNKLFDLGETIEAACEHCHSRYWYPNEKIPAFPTTLNTEPPDPTTKP